MKVTELRSEITDFVAKEVQQQGFEDRKGETFYKKKDGIIRLIHIDFLSKILASYFNSNMASFTLNLGIYFLSNDEDMYPKEYEAHIRGTLVRNFYQKHPMDLKGFSLFHPERRRKDLWWVEKDGRNLVLIKEKLGNTLKKKLNPWLDKYSEKERVLHFLKKKQEADTWKGGPFGFGAIGSPARQELIDKIEAL